LRILYSDAHCHTNPVYGLGAGEISRLFKKHNGWFIALVSLPPYYYGYDDFSLDSYRKVIELMIREKKIVLENGLRTALFIGFHPAEVDYYVKKGFSLEHIVNFADELFNLITKYHEEGFIEGIGEVGRQHYSTSPERIVASEIIMIKALNYAKDHDMMVHLHLEQGGYVTAFSINSLVKMMSLDKRRVILHHVNYETGGYGEKLGYWYTIPAKESELRRALSEDRRFSLVESDYIDDPKRPGVSSYPWDICLRINKLLEINDLDEEVVYRVMVDHVVEAYGVEPP